MSDLTPPLAFGVLEAEEVERLLTEVYTERRRQYEDGFDPEYDDRRGGADYLASTVQRYPLEYLRTHERKRLVQAAAVAIAALQAHDRSRPDDR